MTTISPKMTVIPTHPTTQSKTANNDDAKSLLDTAQLDNKTHGDAGNLISSVGHNPTEINLSALLIPEGAENSTSPLEENLLASAGEVQATAETASIRSAAWSGVKSFASLVGTTGIAYFAADSINVLNTSINKYRTLNNTQNRTPAQNKEMIKIQNRAMKEAVYLAGLIASRTPIPQLAIAGRTVVVTMEIYDAMVAMGMNPNYQRPNPGQSIRW